MSVILSWVDAYQRREQAALIACAQSIDRLNATLCQRSVAWGLAPDNLELRPNPAGTTTIGPVEMQLRQRLGLLADATPSLLRWQPPGATD